MSILSALFADISFFEVGMSLIVLGIVEQVAVRVPRDVVGPGGWLLDTGAAE